MTSNTLYCLTRQTRFVLSLYPNLFYPLLQVKGKNLSLTVNQQTDIVIEGFPRSANSFAVGAFQFAQKQPVSIANHLHAPAQIIRGASLNLPTLLLIRPPVDAVMSLRGLNLQVSEVNQKNNPSLSISLKQYFKQWIVFYTRVLPYHDRYVIGLFDEVTQDFGATIQRINYRFNTDFALFDHTETNVNHIHANRGYHAGPSAKRHELKAMAQRELESSNCNALIEEAEAIYQQYVALANEQTANWNSQNSAFPA